MKRIKVYSLIFLLWCCTANLYGAVTATDSLRIIRADFNKVKGGRNKAYQECVGAGRAAEGLRAQWQQQLAIAKKAICFKYIRFHGLLSDDMHVYTEDSQGNPVYNWQYVDHLYDFLLSIKVRPFVELGFMPPALAENDKTVFWWKGSISTPKSYEKWAALITALVKHFEERYGRQEVQQWYFEVWNEPNLKQFFSGSIDDYFKLYQVTAKAVKAVSASYRVGGPATSGSTWIKEALERFEKYPQLVDFISTHAYGTKSVFDEYGKRTTQMREPDGIPIAIRKLNSDVRSSAFKNTEIHITEWNSSPNPKDPLHDTYQNATFLLNTLKKTEGLVNSMSYWTFTDIFEEAGPPVTSFHGGFGLINLQGILKPSFYAYKFLNELGDKELVNADASSWVCKDGAGNLQALLWDYKLLSPDSSYNQRFYSKILPSKSIGKIKLSIGSMPNGRYLLQVYRVGYHQNDPYTAYLEMGAPGNISLSQEQQLKKVADGSPVLQKDIVIKNGTWQDDFDMRQNDVYFIKLINK
ncbi:GH39 family glycosyl hydrolase [Mucilaginibacter phyllosphaerae]|uniref:Xylan 1,4-beta-xylosidase n=1 Tax=Mucilaginibacter phyllosphaerae TaxID=1812349 RepID=A0ABR6I3U3_9SPHI|nr:glycoside hydrolase [Mucilaginibacter phyllosphaerae]MBB3967705.1 xylan 1,4-beta-xylosidase [Mucilaginibacter phyllosphaerae]